MTAMQEGYPQYTEAQIKEMYENLKLPRRATKGSAGYDFFAPFAFTLAPGETIKMIPMKARPWRFLREPDLHRESLCSMASRKMMMRKESVTAASEAPRSNR